MGAQSRSPGCPKALKWFCPRPPGCSTPGAAHPGTGTGDLPGDVVRRSPASLGHDGPALDPFRLGEIRVVRNGDRLGTQFANIGVHSDIVAKKRRAEKPFLAWPSGSRPERETGIEPAAFSLGVRFAPAACRTLPSRSLREGTVLLGFRVRGCPAPSCVVRSLSCSRSCQNLCRGPGHEVRLGLWRTPAGIIKRPRFFFVCPPVLQCA